MKKTEIEWQKKTGEEGTGLFPLFPVQKWLFKILDSPHHWNISYMLQTESRWDGELLRAVAEKVVSYHEVFFMRFQNVKGNYLQVTDRKIENSFEFEEKDLSGARDLPASIRREMMEAQKRINLFEGPLLVIRLFRTVAGYHLYFVANHLLIDGFSIKALLEDIMGGYMQAVEGKEIVLQKKSDSYLLALKQLYRYAESDDLKEEIPYWEKIVNFREKPFPGKKSILPSLRIERSMTSISALVLSREEHTRLKGSLKQTGATHFEFFLTILGKVIAEQKGEEKVRVNIINHGRDWSIGDLNITRTLGPFWITYPVLLSPGEDLAGTREVLAKVPKGGRGFELLKDVVLAQSPFTAQVENWPDNILFNFVGFLNEYSRMNISGISISPFLQDFNRSPSAACPYTMIFNLRRIEKSFYLQIIYNSYEFSQENITAVMEKYVSLVKESICERSIQ